MRNIPWEKSTVDRNSSLTSTASSEKLLPGFHWLFHCTLVDWNRGSMCHSLVHQLLMIQYCCCFQIFPAFQEENKKHCDERAIFNRILEYRKNRIQREYKENTAEYYYLYFVMSTFLLWELLPYPILPLRNPILLIILSKGNRS